MKKYRMIGISILLFSLLAISACQPAAPTEEAPAQEEAEPETEASVEEAPAAERWTEPIVIGWTPPDVTGVFKTATNFFEQAAADANAHGFDVQVITQATTTHTAFADQVAILEDYIQRDVDVIAISPVEVEVVIPALQKAEEAGIPVIVVNLLEPIEGTNVVSYIGFDNTIGGEVSAYAVLDYFGGPGVLGEGRVVEVGPDDYLDVEFWRALYSDLPQEEVDQIQAAGAIIEGIAGGFFSAARLDGFNGVVDQYPGVTIVGNPCAADWDRELGINCAEDILQSNPEGLDFIWAASNEMGIGAMLAAEGMDRLQNAADPIEVGGTRVAIFTNDLTPESTEYIKEGKIIGETTHGFADWGWFGGQFAVQLACGQEVPGTYDIRPRTAYIENADKFYPEPALPEIDWEAIKAECK